MFYSKQVIAVVLSVVMMLGLTTSAFASTSEVPTPIKGNTQDVQIISIEQDSEVGTYGLGRWFTVKAVQGISKALKAGANNKYVKKAIAEYFDKETAKVFKENLYDIAEVLDDAVELNNLAEDWIEKEIRKVIYKVTKSDEISHANADGVTSLIGIFI